MNEDQKKWLLELQENGVGFENVSVNGTIWHIGKWEFKNDPKDYRIQAQSIPDIPDWRELCREMQSKGVVFEFDRGTPGFLKMSSDNFAWNLKDYRIQQQPIPEWREELNFKTEDTEYPKWSNEEMTEETKPDPRDEIPHRELQIQWHEDMLHHLKTGGAMREWEFRFNVGKEKSGWLKFCPSEIPAWDDGEEYRRKPRTVTYWHCAVMFDGLKTEVITGYCKDEVIDQNKRWKEAYLDARFSPITETTVEMED